MSFGDEIFRALTGRHVDPHNFNAMVREAGAFREERGMSRREFARQTGIPESTLRRWEKDGVNARAQEARLPQLVNAYRQIIADPATVDRWRNNGMVIHVDGVPSRGGSGSTETRSLSANQLRLSPGTGDRVISAFLAGDDKGAAQAFVRGIGDPFYRHVMFGGWIAGHDEDLSDLAYEGGDEYDGDGYFVSASAS